MEPFDPDYHQHLEDVRRAAKADALSKKIAELTEAEYESAWDKSLLLADLLRQYFPSLSEELQDVLWDLMRGKAAR